MKIVITGGHITPALATMDALKRKRQDIEFHFFGRLHAREGDTALSAEYEIMKSMGIPFYPITTGRLQRTFTRYTVPSLFKIPKGFWQSYKHLQQIKPDIIVSFGGYLAVPVVIAGRLLRIPVVSHEQTLVPGLANQIISKFANVLALSFEESKKNYPNVRTVVTGNPIRDEIFNRRGIFNFDKRDLPALYVTGGNQGSHIINQTIFELLPRLLERMHVIHQTGNAVTINDFAEGQKLARAVEGGYAGSYFVFDYVGPDMIGDVFNYSDVVVSRAGVNILCDLFALGKKAIIIPIPKTSNNEQGNNADFFARTGLGTSLSQSELSADRLFQEIIALQARSLSIETIQHVRSLIHLDAGDRLADVVLAEV